MKKTGVQARPDRRRRCLAAALIALLSAGVVGASQQEPPAATQTSEQERAAALALSGAQEAIAQKEYDTAVTLLENFLFEHPGHPQALSTLAYTYGLQHRYREAVDLYRQTLEVDPSLAEARLNLATLLLFQEEKPAEAAAELERVLEALPDSYEAHFYLAIALERQEQTEQALVHYRRAAELNPEAAEPRRSALALVLSRHDWAAAQKLVTELQKLSRDDPELDLLEAELLSNQGKAEGALAAYERYLERAESSNTGTPSTVGEIHMRAGWLARTLGKAEDTLRHFRAARDVGGDYYRRHSLQEEAETLAWLGRYQEALPLYEEIVAATPDDADLLAGLGFVYLQTKQYAKAVPPLARTLQLDPKRTEVYNHLVSALFAEGNFAGVVEVLERRAQRAAETPATLYMRAVSYDKLVQCGLALQYYQQFLDTKPDTTSDQYFQASARARFLKKTCRDQHRE